MQDILEKNEWIKDSIKDVETVVINIETLNYNKNSKTHLTVYDVIDTLKDNGNKNLIIAHINSIGELDEEWGVEIAELIESETGVKCFYPGAEGLIVNL